MTPTIVAHGGAWDWDDASDVAKTAGLEAAVAVGQRVLLDGGSALDAVEQTVIQLENNPAFDAGTGGYLNQDGVVELDALIVDGSCHNFGSIGAVSRVRNPITLARKVMVQTEQCFVVGPGADRMAEQLGIPLIGNAELVTQHMLDFYLEARKGAPSSGHDTVGAVAIDVNGDTAAATSTSGTPFKPAGRVGDAPLYGAGGYARNGVGTAGATGLGENIMRTLLAKYVVDQMANGLSIDEAAAAAMRYVEAIFPDSMSGLIMIDANGKPAGAHTTPKLAWGYAVGDGGIEVAMKAG